MPPSATGDDACSAWNPGIQPGIPSEYRPLETILRQESVSSTLEEVSELAQLTGLKHEELVAFRPERLALHELIVRVTAEIVVAEGAEEEEFGRNFREIVAAIWQRDVLPHLTELAHLHAQLRARAMTRIRRVLGESLFRPATGTPPPRHRFPFNLLRNSQPTAAAAEPQPDDEYRVIAAYRTSAVAARDPLERAVYRSLHRVLGRMAATRGRVGPDQELLQRLVCNHVANGYGSQLIGQALDPLVDAAIAREGYTRIRNREAPVLISLKGASAAGKSSLRPMLKRLMREQGIEPDGYATISPDVWRRVLLDYDSLGPAYKYAGPLTSREVMVIDGKLDRYIRRRADRDGRVPHFLVDRFRFDSFSSEQVERVLHNTYAKYVDTMYMYFVVTAPEETVERGWRRGLERGRYKAVEDFLGHSVEAYVGMPRLLFKWLDYARPRFRYFFLDNMVPKGTFPRTIAHGTQAEMTVLDPVGLVDIERFQKINLKARSPDAVYPATADLAPERNCAFLRQCLRRIATVHFVERNSGATYLRARGGEFERVDMPAFARVLRDPECAAILRELAPELVPAIEREDATAP